MELQKKYNMATNYTLTFDEKVRGWTSFHSFYPEYMVNMNNEFFTFKDGQIYVHNQQEGARNTFYGEAGNTEVEFVMNESPSDVKILKAISLESNDKTWDATITTDLDQGHINKESLEDKEGLNYAYIRRNSNADIDTSLLSVQGIGEMSSLNSNTLTFGYMPNNICVGDTAYYMVNDEYVKIGLIDTLTGDTLIIDSLFSVPNPGDFIFCVKNSIAESYGLKGYYASLRLTTESTDPCELFAVNTEVVKSFP